MPSITRASTRWRPRTEGVIGDEVGGLRSQIPPPELLGQKEADLARPVGRGQRPESNGARGLALGTDQQVERILYTRG